jgi:hypothetical protein
MKYKIYLEDEYQDFAGDLEPDREIECSPDWLDYELKDYCDYLYSNRDGWEWMKGSSERILAIDESGEKLYYSFEVEFEPTFYVYKNKD